MEEYNVKSRPKIVDSQTNIVSGKPIILVTIYLDMGTVRYATKEINLDGNIYREYLSDLGAIDQKIDLIAGGLGTISDFDFSLKNIKERE